MTTRIQNMELVQRNNGIFVYYLHITSSVLVKVPKGLQDEEKTIITVS
jgi:hypothetical protein